MSSINSLSQLKRVLQVGTKFKVIDHCRPELIGQIREVTKVQTNGIYTILPDNPEHKYSTCNGGKGSWMEYNKSSYYEFDGRIRWYAMPVGSENNELIMEIQLV